MIEEKRYYTYTDYASWANQERYELIAGVPHLIRTPNWQHQRILTTLAYKVNSFLEGQACQANIRVAVRLNANGNDDTIVKPDLLVICDPGKITLDSVLGAPDMIFEIQSPDSKMMDMSIKFSLYREFGVIEYWVIDIQDRKVYAFTFGDGELRAVEFTQSHIASSKFLAGFEISLAYLFSSLDS